jgi:hypothetical protein
MDENDQEQAEVRILVGEWVSTREFAERLRQLGEQDDSADEREDD